MKKKLFSIIRKFLHFFWNLHAPLVKKNIRFKGIHSGTCLIFGNGGSLKYFDFEYLPKYPAIVCANSLLDRRMKNVDVRYFVLADSYAFYPVYYNGMKKKFKKNIFVKMAKKLFRQNSNITFFTSISSIYGVKSCFPEVVYYNHYERRNPYSNDLAGSFATNEGSLDAMIGIAKYMGFTEAIVLGCDYLCTPALIGHFYSNNPPASGDDHLEFRKRIEKVAEGIKLFVVTSGDSKVLNFPSISYTELTKRKEQYQENYEIIDPSYMDYVKAAARDGILYL